MIYDNILQVVGNTPTVRLNRIGNETGVEYSQVRILEPRRLGEGSHAVRMVDELEKSGRVGPGLAIKPPAATWASACMTAA